MAKKSKTKPRLFFETKKLNDQKNTIRKRGVFKKYKHAKYSILKKTKLKPKLMIRNYQIKPLIWLVKDEASARFHVKKDDYFGTIATILSLLRQQIKKNPIKYSSDFQSTLNNLEKDLIWLQKNYQIKPRIKKKKIIPKGNDMSQ